MGIYGQYGGPTCRHYSKLTYAYSYGRKRDSGVTHVAVWAGAAAPGPHSTERLICLPTTAAGCQGDDLKNWRYLTESEFLDVQLDTRHSRRIRKCQAETAKKHGFQGPIKGGEARALSRFLHSIGKGDHVKRLWLMVPKNRKQWPGTAWEQSWTIEVLRGPVYAFKPFLDGFSFDDFMRVFHMMRPGTKDVRTAIKEAMANPTMKDDLDMLSVFDTLGSLGGSK